MTYSCLVAQDMNNDNILKKDKFNTKKLYESFYDVLKYSNFQILKCYNLIFNINIFKNNLGSNIIISYI